MNYWIQLTNGAQHHGYFVRFERHSPSAQWATTRQRQRAYAFASSEDAQRVVDQLAAYGRQARIIADHVRAPAQAAAQTPFLAPAMQAPEHLRVWVDKILNLGLINGKPSSTTAERIKTGYRILARKIHPDVGGATADMQRLGDAYVWPQNDPRACRAWFSEMSWFWSSDDSIPDVGENRMPSVTDDDIPF